MRPMFGRSPAALSQDSVASVRIFLVDDHPILIRGLRALVESQPGWVVCGVSNSHDCALEAIRAQKPDLVMVDLSGDGHKGLELVRHLRDFHPRPRALVFSMHDESLYATRALRAGAAGYLMKHADLSVVLAAIDRVLQGGIYLSEAMVSRAEPCRGDPPGESLFDRMGRLTNRELHVFRLLGQGRSTQEIAGLLSVSVKTVGSHRLNMMAKLRIRHASRLIQLAIASNGAAGPEPEQWLAPSALTLESSPSG